MTNKLLMVECLNLVLMDSFFVSELVPVFIVSGASGVGKTITLEACSRRLGVSFTNVDCNNIISNTTTQMKANVKNIFKAAQDCSPTLLQLSHAEVSSII